MNTKTPKLVHPSESILFTASLIISIILWLALTVFTLGIGLLYALSIGLFLLCVQGLFMARIKGYGVRVSANQYPEIQKLIDENAEKMGLKKVPEAYIYDMSGLFNAFATHFLSRDFIILTTELIQVCENDSEKLSFVITHELTHLQRKHTRRMALLAPSKIVPFLGSAYSRVCEYTCDAHAAYYGSTNLTEATKSVSLLATVNSKMSDKLNFEAYEDQTRTTSQQFWPTIMELNASHPITGKRVLHLQRILSEGDAVPLKTKRNILGIIFALVFNIRFWITIYIIFFFGAISNGIKQGIATANQPYYQDANYNTQDLKALMQEIQENQQ